MNSKWFKTLVVAIVLAIGVFWTRQRQENALLRRDNESLTRQLKRIEHLEIENGSRSNQVADADATISKQQLLDLLRLRNEVGMFRRQTNELRQMQEHLEHLKSAAIATAATGSLNTNAPTAPLAVYPKTSWGNVGYSTPENAFQTLNWAALSGDFATIRAAMTSEMQRDFDKQVKDNEVGLAEEIKETFINKSEVRILSKNEVTDKLVVLEVDDKASASGKQGSSDKLVFQLIDGAWKLAADH